MQGPHGHVVPRPDGMRARCGGPALCPVCQRELAASEVIGYKIGDQVYDPAEVTIVRRAGAPAQDPPCST